MEKERQATQPRDLNSRNQAAPPRSYQEDLDISLLPVYSSWIASIEHDHDTGQLVIHTKSHGDLIYLGVPLAVYDDFFAANSKGTFYNQYIKGRYTYAGRRV